MIPGHGLRVMCGTEIYKDRPVCYSLGNFATYGMFTLRAATALTAIFEIKIAADGKVVGGKLYAGKQPGKGGPVLDPTGEGIRKVRELSIADFGTNAPKINDDGTFH